MTKGREEKGEEGNERGRKVKVPPPLQSYYSLPVCPHCTNVRRIRCQADLYSFLLENWRPPLGSPHTTWMKTTQQDLESLNLSLNEAVDVAQNHPLSRMMSMFGTMHS